MTTTSTRAVACAAVSLFLAAPAGAAAPAFPEAQGWGATTPGGRGGRVIEVTNLKDDDNPGSLRYALQATGPRIVVFRVAGTITLGADAIQIQRADQGNLTVAGQTAPGSGITVRGNYIRLNTHDVVMRYLTIRPNRGGDVDCLKLDGPCDLHVYDHLSLEWAADETVHIYGSSQPNTNITVQRSLLGAGLEGHSCGIICGGYTYDVAQKTEHIDIVQNAFIHFENRMPFIKCKGARVANNLVYHAIWMMTHVGGGASVDLVNNVYKRLPEWAPIGQNNSTHEIYAFSEDSTHSPTQQGGYPVTGKPSLYVVGNKGPHAGPADDNWPMITWGTPTSNQRPPAECKRATPQAGPALSLVGADQLEAALLDDVGNSRRLDAHGRWVWRRDSVDQQLIDDYRNGTGALAQLNAVVYPPTDPGTPYADDDHDGMADEWEKDHGFDPAEPADGNLDADGDGYTNVEEFLNGTDPKSAAQADAGLPGPGDAGAPTSGDGGQTAAADAGLVGWPQPTLRIAQAAAAPVIDGKLDEAAWNAAEALAFDDSGSTGLSDNQVQVRALWDAQKLYVGYAVKDASLKANGDTQAWNDDGVEFLVDTLRGREVQLQPDDWHFIVNVAGAAFVGRGNGTDETNVTAQFTLEKAYAATADGYVVEVALPWSALSFTPAAGKLLGGLLANNDLDTALAQFAWADVSDFKAPDRWGTFLLDGPPGLDAGQGGLDAGEAPGDASSVLADATVAPAADAGTTNAASGCGCATGTGGFSLAALLALLAAARAARRARDPR